jgi:intron-binding protein aquarius
MAARPNTEDVHGNDHFAQVARKTWLKKSGAPKFKAQTLKKEIWDALEQDDFPHRSLLLLENLQLLEL